MRFGHFANFVGFFAAHLAVANAVFDERIILGARAAKSLAVEKIFSVHQREKSRN
jgi:hypothetical protein